MRSARFFWLALLGPLTLGLAPASRAGEFALRDGDTVAFMGDSITAARTYGKIIENYTLLRFPDRKVRFLNVGIGGDTAAGGLKRLERDVFANNVTVLTVAFGVNDIGWGLKADDEHKRRYLESIRGIVEACRKRGVRVYICSAAVTAQDPEQSETSFLQKMCDEGMAISRELGGHAIDVQRGMRAIQKRVWGIGERIPKDAKRESLHIADGVHLSELGQLAMAFAILKGLDAPADVSSVSVDARGPKLLEAKGCTVTELAAKDRVVEFTRLDEGLPYNQGLFFTLNFRYVPIPDQLNRYLLTVANLPPGQYDVTADGRSAGTFTAVQLADGINIASTTADAWQPGGPWNAQASLLQHLTDARHQVAIANSHARVFLPTSPATEALGPQADQADAQLVAMQRAMARPRPYRFVIKPHVPPPGKK
jgi:lysophospholipase L1-like esterase